MLGLVAELDPMYLHILLLSVATRVAFAFHRLEDGHPEEVESLIINAGLGSAAEKKQAQGLYCCPGRRHELY